MEQTSETTTEETKSNGWAGAVEASKEATEASPEVIDKGTLERTLPCKLDEKELLDLGQKLAAVHAEIDQVEEEAKATASRHREKLKELYEGASAHATTLRSGEEQRRVVCSITHIPSLNVARIMRKDTFEIIEDRPLTFHERQTSLPGVGEREDANLGDEPDDEGDGEPVRVTEPLTDEEIAELDAKDAADGTDITDPEGLAADPAYAKGVADLEETKAAKAVKRGRKS